jgi:hypothetical protein
MVGADHMPSLSPWQAIPALALAEIRAEIVARGGCCVCGPDVTVIDTYCTEAHFDTLVTQCYC